MRSVSKVFGILACGFAVALCAAPGAAAEKEAPYQAHVADDDFPFQGEYTGTLTNAANYLEPVGLQVVALGDGKFQATDYRGGLPGQGWDGVSKSTATGERSDNLVRLAGDQHRVAIRDGHAWIWDAS